MIYDINEHNIADLLKNERLRRGIEYNEHMKEHQIMLKSHRLSNHPIILHVFNAEA